ncbi:MAG: MopE-related protein, partial [Myxococcota bacterium]|nr:MopE-related protein [Myxococcota bacterium]
SDQEGATWTFDPEKVSLNQGASSSGTNYRGARILDGNGDVQVLGEILPGTYDGDDHERYAFWEGNTLYFGVEDTGSQNSVDAIVEFFWFESSIPRGSDFYVMLLKVKSSPNAWDNWRIVKEENMGLLDQVFLFWQDVQPAQWMSVFMEPGGAHGSLRWDFSVPFETYLWEPYKTMQIQESYGAGFDVGAGADEEDEAAANEASVVGQAAGLITAFSEGGAVLDLTNQLLVQAKGNVNESFKIETQYTVTLYRWMMLVQSGGEDMHYKLAALPAEDDQEAIDEDSAYAEYFIVMQAERGTPVHINNIEIGGQFKRDVPFWFDNFQPISASLGDIWISPPTGVCLPGEIAPAGTCEQEGVCGLVAPKCSSATNQWTCPVVASFEEVEVTCDGLDNDCDGTVDEFLSESCSTACGTGTSWCIDGAFQACDAVQPEEEICDGLDNDCDGAVDNLDTRTCESACGQGALVCIEGQDVCVGPTAGEEVCDGIDNDCDGEIDEGQRNACGHCGPVPEELCDGVDNDCDGETDEGLFTPCSSDCGTGHQQCVDGDWTNCSAQPALDEV